MPLKINGATNGSVTLAAPATGSDVTLTLPSTTGTLPLSADMGLVKITDQTFSAASSVNINNCFTSTYDNYRILIDLSAASTTVNFRMRLRASGADNTNNSYVLQEWYSVGATTSSQQVTAQQWNFATLSTTYAPYFRVAIDLFSPQLTRYTAANSDSPTYGSSGIVSIRNAFLFNATTSFDGFSLLTDTGNVTGTVRVYGYRN